ncbi:hypothetical protein SEA_TEMPO_49 [Microbacterium phage Tempo]|nr:hypothetical protein SEA_TEMPO_49 [Microbacterium phage Tempo]QKO02801.1 hypothetical protein SEA_KELCOLE_48 [Microbacterium phage Kelcole]UOW92794.1 hypothetical protein SEA_ROBINROSE_51 [Microbacterium phage RobinRose]WNT44260.1 hypothetical protein SEA_CANDC_48 [Microbacterium phage CandC]
MAIANYTTAVTVRSSVDSIVKLLAKAGARSITHDMDEQGLTIGLSFVIATEYGWRPFRLPIRVDGVHATLKRDRVPPRYQTRDHAARVAWRIAHDWLRAQLAIIDAGMTTLPEVFFPYVLLDAETTAYEKYVGDAKELMA